MNINIINKMKVLWAWEMRLKTEIKSILRVRSESANVMTEDCR